MLNKVQLIGNVGRDPEVRRTNSGDAVISFSLATTEYWRDKSSGQRKDKTEWHNIVIWNEGLGQVAEKYLKKGSKVYLEGQLQTRKFTDRDGNERSTTEIVLQRFRGELKLLDGKSSGDSEDRRDDRGADSGFGRSSPMQSGGGRMNEILDDDVPF